MDTTRVAQPRQASPEQAPPASPELMSAACAAMRLLQDRQTHTPEEMLDGRERKVLRQLRDAVRRAAVEAL